MDKKPRISIVVAIARQFSALNAGGHAMGVKNDLLWRISDDLKRFKKITLGHPIIMGRKTYESIGRPLPGRMNIVITRQSDYAVPEGVRVVSSVDEAIELASLNDPLEIFVIGGGEVFRQVMDRVDRLYLTLVKDPEADSKADVFFPPYPEFTKVLEKENRQSDGFRYEWITLERE